MLLLNYIEFEYNMGKKRNIRFSTAFILVALCYLSIACVCAAQSVPQGSILWLRADSGVVQENGLVAVWHDQSGNGNDVTQQDTSFRTTLLTSGINGLSCIHFNGGSYFNAPSIFPANSDYSVAGVLRLSDTTQINNVLSGNIRAIWFNSTSYLQVHHWIFQLDAEASAPVRPQGSRFIVTYNAALSTVRIFIDGRLSDSLWIYPNTDPTMYVGAFEGGYVLHADLSELLLYSRELDSTDETQLDNYLSTKYDLSERPAPPPPDTTFTNIPQHLQFFPRGSDDSSRFLIAGSLHAPGFDSMYVEFFQNDILIGRSSAALVYNNGGASFSFPGSIHAERSEYAIRVGVLRQGFDSILAYRDSLVCGDAYLVSGQSNAFVGYSYQDSLNEFCRTLGISDNHNTKDTLWSVAQSVGVGWGNCIGAWAYQMAHMITDSLQLPVCILDGATLGGFIQEHLRDDSDPLNMGTPYGDLLYRAQKAHVDHAVKAFLWDQGEWDTDFEYYSNFLLLRNAWLEDYPSLQKIYVIQIRPISCKGGGDQRPLKELQRHFADSLPGIVVHASAAIPQYFDCHFGDTGYTAWGTQMYHLIGRDFYQRTDTVDIASPNVREAFYTTPAHDTLELVFSPADCHLTVTPDTVIGGMLRRMKDYLYLNDSIGMVQSIRAVGNTLFLAVTNPFATSITYLPDAVYPDDSVIYEGPWIVNARGVGAFIWYDLPITDQPSSVNEQSNPISNAEIIPDPASRTISIDASQLTGPVEATMGCRDGSHCLAEYVPLRITHPCCNSILAMRVRDVIFCD